VSSTGPVGPPSDPAPAPPNGDLPIPPTGEPTTAPPAGPLGRHPWRLVTAVVVVLALVVVAAGLLWVHSEADPSGPPGRQVIVAVRAGEHLTESAQYALIVLLAFAMPAPLLHLLTAVAGELQ